MKIVSFFLERCLPLRASDEAFGSDVHCVSDVSPCGEVGKHLKANHESVISNQIGRSGTSIGANIHEAQYAQGKKDFISKLEIALKEASETGYWLDLAYRTNYIDEKQYRILSDKCATLRIILVSSCKTAKSNIDNK